MNPDEPGQPVKWLRRNSTYHYRRWCKHLREECKLNPRRRGFARHQWNLYWDGVRDSRLHDAAFWLITEFGYD